VRVALMLGLILAVLNYVGMVFLTDATQAVAITVSLAMFITVIIAKALGCTLPLLAKTIHLDPALMASPIITTLVDAASLTVLFTIATRVLNIG